MGFCVASLYVVEQQFVEPHECANERIEDVKTHLMVRQWSPVLSKRWRGIVASAAPIQPCSSPSKVCAQMLVHENRKWDDQKDAIEMSSSILKLMLSSIGLRL